MQNGGNSGVPPPPPGVYPVHPPKDPALHDRIIKLCEHVSQRSNNGHEFIKLVKKKEATNPEFAFLFPGQEGNEYYEWKKYCLAYGVDEKMGLKPPNSGGWHGGGAGAGQSGGSGPPSAPRPPEQHRSASRPPEQHGSGSRTLEQQRSAPKPRRQYSETPPMPNTPPLSDSEKKELAEILKNLEGSKESIKRAGAWIMKHRGKCVDSVLAIKETVLSIPFYDFDKKLHLCWLINDLLHESMQLKDPSQGMYSMDDLTKAIANVLVKVLRGAWQGYRPDQQNKINCLLGLWGQRQIFSHHLVNYFGNSMVAGAPQFNQGGYGYGGGYGAGYGYGGGPPPGWQGPQGPEFGPPPDVDHNMWGQPAENEKPYSCLHLSPGYVVDVLLTLRRNEGLKPYEPIKIEKLPNFMPVRMPKTPNYILDKYQDFERDLEDIEHASKRRRT